MQMVQRTRMRNIPVLNAVRYLGLFFFLILLLGLVVHFVVQYARYAYEALSYPFSIDYGEGIVWQQALLIPGEKMYGDIDAYPFIVFHYPPVYHLTVRALAFVGLEYLTAGRALSLVSTLSIAILIALLILRATRQAAGNLAYIAAAIAGLTIFTSFPIFGWSLVMRVDMLAIALGFLGVYFAVLSRDRPALLYWSTIAFVLAVYTKQNLIAAPISALSILLLVKPKEAIRAAGLAAVLALALFLILDWQTDGGFARHVVLYNINRFSAMWGIGLLSIVFRAHGLYLLVVTAFLVVSWLPIFKARRELSNLDRLRSRLNGDPWFFGLSLFTVYLLVTTAMLLSIGKVGATYNYFIEWICVWCLILGMAVAAALRIVWQTESTVSLRLRLALGIGLPVLLMGQLLINPAQHIGLPDAEHMQQARAVLQLIEAAPKPVLSEEMTLLMRAGKGVPMEPAIFQELAHKGIWNQDRIIDLIKSHFFEFVVIGDRWTVPRWTAEVRRAIEVAYPRVVKYPPYSVYLPSD
jgi:hypothetical protein